MDFLKAFKSIGRIGVGFVLGAIGLLGGDLQSANAIDAPKTTKATKQPTLTVRGENFGSVTKTFNPKVEKRTIPTLPTQKK